LSYRTYFYKKRQAIYVARLFVFWHPSRVLNSFLLLSGGLRFAATTACYLTALQAESVCRVFTLALAGGPQLLRRRSQLRRETHALPA
jgi:hypothetical protein